MKKLFLILSLFTCFKAFGQTIPPPVSPQAVTQMSWFREPSTNKMFANRGPTLGWWQPTDSLQVVRMIGGISPTLNFTSGLTKSGNNVTLGGALTQPALIGINDYSFTAYGVNSAATGAFNMYNGGDEYQFGVSLSKNDGSRSILFQTISDGHISLQSNVASTSIGFSISPDAGFSIGDNTFNRGLVYEGDYSTVGKLNDRWIPDWGTVKGAFVNLTSTQTNIVGNKSFLGFLDAPVFQATSYLQAPEILLGTPSGSGFSASQNATYTALRNYDAVGSVNGYQLTMNRTGGLVYENWLSPSGTISFTVNGKMTATGTPTNPNDVVRLADLQTQTFVNVVNYGADTTGTVKSDNAFKQAIAATGTKHVSTIYVPRGSYKLDSILVLPPNVKLLGDGPQNTTIRASGVFANYVSPDPIPIGTDGLIHAFIYSSGQLTNLGKLTATSASGDFFVKANTGLGLHKGDVIKVSDTTSFSYSAFRSYYREGEFFRVINYSADTIYLDHSVTRGFTNVNSAFVYKLTGTANKITDINIVGLAAGNMRTIFIDNSDGLEIKNINVSKGARSNIEIRGGYNLEINHVKSLLDTMEISGFAQTSYGLDFIGCQNFSIRNSILYGWQHGFAATGNTGYYGVVNRFGTVDNNFVSSTEAQFPGMNLHGNCEFITFSNNQMTGIEVGGADITIKDNYLLGMNAPASYMIALLEVKRASFNITGNVSKYNTNQLGQTSRLFNMTLDNNTDAGGFLNIKDNTFKVNNTLYTGVNFLGQLTAPTIAKDMNIKMRISGNTILNNSAQSSLIDIRGVTGFSFGSMILENNEFGKAAVQLTFLDTVQVRNNTFRKSFDSGLRISQTNDTHVENNHFDGYVLNPSVNPAVEQLGAFSVQNSTNVWLNGNTGVDGGVNAVQAYYTKTITNLYEGSYVFGTLLPVSGGSITNQQFYSAPNMTFTNLSASLPMMTTASKRMQAAQLNLASATQFGGTNAIIRGGTGTATPPSIGQVMVATSTTVYTPTTPTGTGTPVFSASPTITGTLTIGTAGSKLAIAEGTNGRVGQTTLVAGTVAITISGLTTSSRAFVQLVAANTTALTTSYQAVCTANTLTIRANVAAGTINVADISTLNYFVLN